jgi:hypothetical protein
MKDEIIPDIRNKLQAPYLVLERLTDGKSVPEHFMELAKSDLTKVEELIRKLE